MIKNPPKAPKKIKLPQGRLTFEGICGITQKHGNPPTPKRVPKKKKC